MPLIPAEDAFARLRRNPHVRWPDRASGRLYGVCDPVLKPRFRIVRNDRIFTVGSCFARNIEIHLADMGVDLPTVRFSPPTEEKKSAFPNGILNKYTPPEILHEFAYATDGEDYMPAARQIAQVDNDQSIDLHLATPVPVSHTRALDRRREVRALFREALDCQVVIITMGLIEAWRDEETGSHILGVPSRSVLDRYPGRFSFEVLSRADCLESMARTIDLLNSHGCEKKILLSVSPVPLRRTFSGDDIVVANMHSKSVLRVIANELCQTFGNVDYLPTYESILYSAPDIAWKADLRHVTELIAAHNVLRAIEAWFEPDAMDAEAVRSRRDDIDRSISLAVDTGSKTRAPGKNRRDNPLLKEAEDARNKRDWPQLRDLAARLLDENPSSVPGLRMSILAAGHLLDSDTVESMGARLLQQRASVSDSSMLEAARSRIRRMRGNGGTSDVR